MPRKPVDMFAEAMRYVALGWWVVPQAGKSAVALGWNRWQLSEADLHDYLSDGSLNIAVNLQQAGLVDVECDSAEAAAALGKLVSGDDLVTPTWESRRGVHRLYLRPEGLPQKAVVHAKGIEFRLGNNSALSTLPPSTNVDEQGQDDGTRKRWLDGLSVHDVQPLPLPKSLVKLINKEAGRKRSAELSANSSDKITQGTRTTAIMSFAGRLVRVGLSPEEIATTVANHNLEHCDPPLTDAEVFQLIDGACRIKERVESDAVKVTPEACSSWDVLLAAWEDALDMRQDIRDALAVLLAVVISTDQVGDQQLFLQFVADAGSAKTRLCDALLVSEHCKLFEHVTGLHSGWKMGGDDKDFSMITRINHCTLITPEGDTVISSPKFPELMSQFRRVFDGSSSATWKNRDVDLTYQGLRTPWVIAGTRALLGVDQSRLGDRFIRVCIDPPPEEVKQRIQRRVALAELANVRATCNSSPESQLNPKMRRAYKITGGYVDYLRLHPERLISAVRVDEESVIDRIMSLADFTACLRSLPDPDPRKKDHDAFKELPSRLTAQYTRLALCLAAAIGREEVDDEVLRIVRKVAKDTARGKPYDIAAQLAHNDATGVFAESLSTWTNTSEERVGTLLRHMRRIKAVRVEKPSRAAGVDTRQRWHLTAPMLKLWREVVG